MGNNKSFSQIVSVFHGRKTPEEATIAGYGAIIDYFGLPVPLPQQLSLISTKRRQYKTDSWQIFTPRHQPSDDLYSQLIFALKYEGIDLLIFKKLFEKIDAAEIEKWVAREPSSIYSRKIWFLYEWLMQKQLKLPDLKTANYVPLLDEKLQYAAAAGVNSARHRIRNNLPGNINFCPLIYKTPKLEKYINENYDKRTDKIIKNIHKDILLRTSAFLLLKDSKASFFIEGENPGQNRAMRWGRAIAEAGEKALTQEELLRLQQIVIGDQRFLKMGYRTEGGFVGEHDRTTGEPIPDHISAKWQDIDLLMQGLTEAAAQLKKLNFEPVLAAAKIAFGFVFIHPFADGNGRLHRYIIHHLLAAHRFTPQGIIFPVSAAILEKIEDYRKVLESYSHPLLDLIEWRKTTGNNVEVLNETIDYYRYFDVTKQAEFLFECIDYTIHKIIPQEVAYLQKFDAMKNWLADRFSMPDKMVAQLIRFLDQNNGILSKRAREKEFAELKPDEITAIEKAFAEIMFDDEL